MTDHLDVVFLDVGGPLYADDTYYRSLLAAIREVDPSVTGEAYAEVYDACRRAQDGSFRTRLTRTLLGPEASVEEVAARAERHWLYPPEALVPDVVPALEALAGRYRLGVLANQTGRIREVMRRDGIDRFFELWNVSAELGVEKPDPRIFRRALDDAGVPPGRAAMVGDRLDNDVRPAKAAGMRGVWLLRGEAPDDPTPEQLDEPDAVIRSLGELPDALERLRHR
ncbi:MAG TPA: HAD family hydrolase [Actinomycetota bacterium]|nr:HAD family hydrolase [Actinomycetota bacterium]